MSELTLKRRRSGAISGSERITGVKNAQADVLLLRKKQQFDVLFRKKEQDIQLEEHRLANENKLLHLESKRNDLEYKRRLYPEADLSNEEMTVANLEKYLVKNANKLCYTDKSLETKVRIRCSTDNVPPIVSEARTTIVKREIVKAVEKNRKQMYQFLDKPVSRQHKKSRQEEVLDEIDEFEKAMREDKLPEFAGHLMPEHGHKDPQKPVNGPKQHHLALPRVEGHLAAANSPTLTKQSAPATVKVKVPPKELEKQEIHRKLKQNPVVREAVDAHHKEKYQSDHLKSSQNVERVLTRMAQKKPPTKTQVKEEQENVRCQVGAFCERIEALLWDYKEEQFRQGIKFIKDKDAAWNRFMDTMKTRTSQPRGDNPDKSDEELYIPKTPILRRPTTSVTMNSFYSEKEKQQMLLKNLLLTKPRLLESAPPVRKRGMPHHTEERSYHHSPRAKLQRMLEQNKNILDAVIKAAQEKDESGNAGLIAATKQSQAAAL